MGCYDQAAVRALWPNKLRPKRSSGGKDKNKRVVAVKQFVEKGIGKFEDRGPATHLTRSLKPNAPLCRSQFADHTVALGLAPLR